MSNHLILKSYSLDKKTYGQVLDEEKLTKELASKRLAWVHLHAGSGAKDWLKKNCDYLDSIVINALLAEETRPRVEVYGGGVFVILRCINLNEGSDPEDMVSIRLWIDPHRVISIQKRKVKSIEDIEEYILQGNKIENCGDFLNILVSGVLSRTEPAIDNLDETLDGIEENIDQKFDPKCRDLISDIRRKAIIYRRYMIPQRDALNQFRRQDIGFLTILHLRNLQESYDQITRFIEDLDAVRERSQIIKDEISNILSDRLNRNMYILSIISAIFLPLGFLTGLLGVNLAGIPGAENINSFYIFGGVLGAIFLLQILFFKIFKWI